MYTFFNLYLRLSRINWTRKILLDTSCRAGGTNNNHGNCNDVNETTAIATKNLNASYSEDSVAETALSKKNSDGQSNEWKFFIFFFPFSHRTIVKTFYVSIASRRGRRAPMCSPHDQAQNGNQSYSQGEFYIVV